MPKISKIRIVNLTYNDNRHVYDETFDCFDGENTLLTLANGGGKTVLVQMLIEPVIPNLKLKNRPFESFFEKSSYPTYIMTEWLLDNDGGKLLTGIGARKVSKIAKGSNEINEDLKMIMFTHEYKEANDYDIDHIPVTLEENDQTRMIPFDEIEKKFSTLEKVGNYKFRLYRYSNREDRAKYTDELKSYKISRDEFEEFIVKINEREGGLDTYFEKRKTSKALINAEFLPLIEARLNKEGNTIKNIHELISNHAENLVRNEAILREKDIYERFKVKSQEILLALEQYNESLQSIAKIEGEIGNLYAFFKQAYEGLEQKEKNYLEELMSISNLLKELAYEKASNDYHVEHQALSNLNFDLAELEATQSQLKTALGEQENTKAILECAKLYQEYLKLDGEIIKNEASLNKERLADSELTLKIQDIEFTLNQKYTLEVKGASDKVTSTKGKMEETSAQKKQLDLAKTESNETLKVIVESLKRLDDRISKFFALEERMRKFPEFTLSLNPITGEYDADEVNKYRKLLEQKASEITKIIDDKKALKESNVLKIKEAQVQARQFTGELEGCRKELQQTSTLLEKFQIEKEQALGILKNYEIDEEHLFVKSKIISTLDAETERYTELVRQFNLELHNMNKELTKYESGRTLELPEDLVVFFKSNHVQVEFGFEWLKNYNNTLEAKCELVKNNPFIPYSLILTRREFERVKELRFDVFTSVTLPILERESLEEQQEVKSLNQVYSLGNVHFLMSFNQELLDEAHLAMLITTIKQKIASLEEEVSNTQKAIDNVSGDKHFFEQMFTWTPLKIEELNIQLASLNEKIVGFEADIKLLNAQSETLGRANDQLERAIQEESTKLTKVTQQITESNDLFVAYGNFLTNSKERSLKDAEQTRVASLVEELANQIQQLALDLNGLEHDVKDFEKELTKLRKEAAKYAKATRGTMQLGSILDLENELTGLSQKRGVKAEWLSNQIKIDQAKQEEILIEIGNYGVEETIYSSAEYSASELEKAKKQIRLLERENNSVHGSVMGTKATIAERNKTLKKIKEDIAKRYDGREPKDLPEITHFNFDEREEQLLLSRNQADIDLAAVRTQKGKYDTWVKSMDDYKGLAENVVNIEPILDADKDAFKRQLLDKYKTKLNESWARKDLVSKLYSNGEKDFSLESPIFKQLFQVILSDDRKFTYEYGSNAINRANLQIDLKLEQYSVDLANMEAMETNIINMAYGYVLNVYSELSSVDSNSAIEIDGLRKKMLEIHLPDKTKLEEILLKQYVKGTIDNCVNLIKQEKPYETALNSEITTERLFDRLVDLNRVDVKILKVEQNKTRPMSWANAINISGGESFVSIFVVFVTLMSYLRGGSALKSFRGNDEGKVIIMDNPFGAITSEHLLIPMFRIAKKYNTQLICFTDIDKHTVIDRFDVVYGMRVEKDTLRDHERLHVQLAKNDTAQTETLSSSLFKIEKKQLSMF